MKRDLRLVLMSLLALLAVSGFAQDRATGGIKGKVRVETGTPGGVGVARKPPVFMQPGDVFEVEIEGVGVLSNPVQDG